MSDDAELRELRLLRAKKKEYEWPDDHAEYKKRKKAIQKTYSELAKEESKSKGRKGKAPGQKMKKYVLGTRVASRSSLSSQMSGKMPMTPSTRSKRVSGWWTAPPQGIILTVAIY